MKTQALISRAALISTVAALACSSISCTTTYDTYGRSRQSVDPAVAIAGVAAAGIIGYAIANDNHTSHHYHRGGGYRANHCDSYDYYDGY